MKLALDGAGGWARWISTRCLLPSPRSASMGWSAAACSVGTRDAEGVSRRQRDKALALIDRHFGADAAAAVNSSTINTE